MKDVYLYKEVTGATDPDPDPDPDPQPEEKTVYWDNSFTNWSTVYAYAWKDGSDPVENNALWPGQQLTERTADGLYVFKYTGDWDKIIFNNASGSQTADKDLVAGTTYDGYKAPGNVYLMGNLDGINEWDPASGLEMTDKGNGVYEADDVEILDALGISGTFCIVTELGSWETVNANRYGPETDATSLNVGDIADMVKKEETAWRLPVGMYKITADLRKNKLTISEASNPIYRLAGLSSLTDTYTGKVVTLKAPATAVAQLGKNLWIKDETGWMLVYGTIDQTYTNGDIIPAGYGGTYKLYNGLPELQNPTGFVTPAENNGAVEPATVTAAAVASQPLNSYIELTGKVEGSGRNYTLTDETGEAAIYTPSADFEMATGEKVLVRGFVSVYAKGETTTYQITPISSEEIIEPSTVNTVFFDNTNSKWEVVYAYAYKAGSDPLVNNAEWPGVKMTEVTEEGLLKIELDKEFDTVVFNEKSVAEGKKTDNLAIVDKKVYSVEATVEPVETNTVFFDNTESGWEKVYAYAWKEGSDPRTENAAWPGVEMTGTEDGKLKIELEKSLDMVVFSNGATTGDILVKTTNFTIVDKETYHYTAPETPAEVNTIYFNPQNCKWEKVYAYAYVKADPADKNDSWPGQEMTEMTAEGLLKLTLDKRFDQVVFNNGFFNDDEGKEQTRNFVVEDNMIYGMPVEPEEPTGTNTIYFDNTEGGWKHVYVYALKENSDPLVNNAEWPGVEITEQTEDGRYIAVLEKRLNKVIFNDGEVAGKRTVKEDIVDGMTYSMPHVERNTVYFDNSNSNWKNVYAYIWRTNSDPVDELMSWPGIRIDEVTEEGLFKLAIDKRYDMIVFNNGLDGDEAHQTYDLVIEDNKTYIHEGDPLKPITGDIYLIGDIPGHQWDPAYKGAKLTNNGDGTYDIKDVVLDGTEKAYFAFAQRMTGEWEDINNSRLAPTERDLMVTLGEEYDMLRNVDASWAIEPGIYDMHLDINTMKLVVTRALSTYPQKLYIIGMVKGHEWTNQNSGDPEPMTMVEPGVYKQDNVVITGNGEMRLATALGTWDIVNAHSYGPATTGTMLVDYGVEYSFGKTEYSLWLINPGRYSFTVDFNTMTISYEPYDIPEKMYVIGDIKGHIWAPDYDGAVMTQKAEGIYEAKGVELDAVENAYFTIVEEPNMDWDMVNAHRYGPATDAQEVAAGVETAVSRAATAWRTAPGTYTMTFDRDLMKLTITKETSTGINTIDAAEGSTERYNLQGMRTDGRQRGIVILRKGGKTVKQMVR
ncbi:MAG: starch-binding protein [Prevotella sp.]